MGRKPGISISSAQTSHSLIERGRKARETSAALIKRIRETIGFTRQNALVMRGLTMDMPVQEPSEGDGRVA